MNEYGMSGSHRAPKRPAVMQAYAYWAAHADMQQNHPVVPPLGEGNWKIDTRRKMALKGAPAWLIPITLSVKAHIYDQITHLQSIQYTP